MNRAADLRADYEQLATALEQAVLDGEGSHAAAIVRERRLIGAELERLESSEVVSLVDELAGKRAESGARRPPARRKSG